MSNLAVKLIDTAASLADGAEIDWDQIDRSLSRESDRRLLQQLRVVAGIADVHRSQPDSEPVEEAVSHEPVRGEAREALEQPESQARAGELELGTWGSLELLERVGEGSFGEVYRARDMRLHREVALKLWRVERGSATDRAERMLNEARILARVRHQNVVAVYGAEEHDGRVGLWMELIHGETLANIMATRGPYSAEEAALIGQDLCRALAAVHAAGLLHRDLKAQNVMREEGGRLVLMDFGAGERQRVPRRERAGRVTGTPLYLAPEVIEGEASTVQSDVYGLGVLLFHLVTGRFPVEASSYDELCDKHERGERTPLIDVRQDLPEAFVPALERAIDPDPARRYRSAGAFQKALAASLAVPDPSFVVEGPPATRAPLGFWHAWTRRQRALLATLGVLLCVGIGAALMLQWRSGGQGTSSDDTPLLAVRPLAARTPDDRYFAAGLTAEIATEVARSTKAVTVMPVDTVERLREDMSAQEVLQKLGAQYLVEGEAYEDDDGGFATIRLVRAGVGTSSWRWPLSQPQGRVSKLQHDAVANVVRVVEARRQAEAAETPQTTDDEAYRTYLRGRYHLLRYDYEEAIALLHRATARDPGYASAWGGLARAYLWRRQFPRGTERVEMIEAARDAANRALRIDPNSGEAHGVLASIADQNDWDFRVAHDAFVRALELNPADEATRLEFANLLLAQGRIDETRTVVAAGRRLDPLAATFVVYDGMIDYYERDYDTAIQAFERGLLINRDHRTAHLMLCAAFRATQDLKRALSSCGHALEAKARSVPNAGLRRFDVEWSTLRSEYAQTLAAAGRQVEARRILSELLRVRSMSRDAVRAFTIAYLCASLGDVDEAFRWLERAVQERDVRFLGMDPHADPLRSDERFARLVARVEGDLQPSM
ncbi:MAG: protein kinase domain-containing protein [Vicinamibacteraceae bacterium]